MSYVSHHAIIVTSNGYDSADQRLREAHDYANKHFGALTSQIISSVFNGYKTFFVAPDGSKEGWDESDEHDIKRDNFIKILDDMMYDDGSGPIRYAEVRYGTDDCDQLTTTVTRSN